MRAKKFRFPDRIRKSRKAQAETQFNWIFVLIVGALIIAFFAFIVVKQRSASEAKFSGKISQQLNTILVSAKVSSGTVQEIPTPEISIRFTCNDYYIGPASQRLGSRVVFAPEYVEGNSIITWTLDWNVPYKVTSFLYITSPLVKYVVVGDGRAAEKIYDALPDKLTKQTVLMSNYVTLSDEGDRHVRFIFVDQTAPSFDIPVGLDGVDVSGLKVNTGERSVQFLVQSETGLITSGQVYRYIEDEILYGAIFADKPDEYDCLVKRAYSRLNIVSSVYYEKLNEMAPMFDATNCEGFYRRNSDINSLVTATDDYPLDVADYATIGNAKSDLRDTNTRLQLQSCPLIY
jgi:hypothetical protein